MELTANMPEQQTEITSPGPRPVYEFFKRVIDIILSLLALIILSPFFLIIAIIIKLESPGPVIFKQKRAGKDGVPFTMYKFRSMCADAEDDDSALIASVKENPPFASKPKEDKRVTRFGRFLRRTSIDEFPQFYNTLRSDMSLVGPRPLPIFEHDALDDYQRQRTLVKPGLTCFWQVSGRSSLSNHERAELDVKYIRERGMLTDISLIFKTIPALISMKGAQ